MTKQGLLDIYEMFGWISIGVAVVVLALSPIVRRWMHLETLQDRDDGLIDIAGSAEAGIEAQEGGMHPPARPAR